MTLVNDGAAAVEAVRAGGFDLVLMDMEMPVMDGLGATRAIRRPGAGRRDIPIIALTASAMPEEVARCRDAGMDDHLAKPIERAALLAAVARWSRTMAGPGATGTPATEVAVLDDEVLRGLERMLGGAKVAALADGLRERLGESIDILAATTDRACLAQEAHSLASFAGNLGCRELTSCSRLLMSALKAGDEDIGPLVVRTADAARRALIAIEDRYPSGMPAPA